jgi:hypothetical protein
MADCAGCNFCDGTLCRQARLEPGGRGEPINTGTLVPATMPVQPCVERETAKADSGTKKLKAKSCFLEE